MPVALTRKALAVSLALIASGCASGGDERAAAPATTPAPAQSACVTLMQFSRTTFVAADENRDGVIDEAEFASDVAAAFAGEDRNRDYQLARAELPEAPSGTFERIDSDRSDVLSFKELMQAKMGEFQRADANGDGVLSISEVMRFNAAQHGGC
jgi:Ca2+-binding EF-hand superfamily protein